MKLFNEKKVFNSFIGFYDLCELYTNLRNSPEYQWLQEMPLTTGRMALYDLVRSYKMFFKGVCNHPKFKSRKKSPKSFKTRSDVDKFYIEGDTIRIEGLKRGDKIRLKFDTGFQKKRRIKYILPSISIDTLGNYWVSFSIETPIEPLSMPVSEPIGVDVGIRHTITLSTGEIFNRPKDKIKKLERRLSRTQRHVTRDIKRRMKIANHTKTKYEDIPVSKRAKKRLMRRNKIFKRITHIKNTFYHSTIKSIVLRNPKAIVIETIRTTKMIRENRNSALANDYFYSDFHKIHQIFKDKCTRYGVTLIQADEEYPSSQICSHCGSKRTIGSQRTYICHNCGLRIDRDINAAINLRNLAY